MSEQGLSELGDLIEAAGGRTLALFSSWRGVDTAFDYLSARFAGSGTNGRFPILRAERGEPVAPAIRQFAEIPESVLLGTLSLWQGVDVPGSACILVVIDRIPFPRPDDPLIAARQEFIDNHGGSGFVAVSVPRAALLLAQGSGRLIRSTADRGVVAVLDPRLASAGYSRALLRSLPPFFATTNGALVRAALSRLGDAASDAVRLPGTHGDLDGPPAPDS
jgi:ATP-dependent DNA helicase DinG